MPLLELVSFQRLMLVQLPIKVKWFKELNDCLLKIKANELDASQMRVLGERLAVNELDTREKCELVKGLPNKRQFRNGMAQPKLLVGTEGSVFTA